MRFWLLALLAATVALGGMSTAHAQANVQITSIVCPGDAEAVGFRNNGSAAQDLTGWQLRSDPVDTEFLDLTPLGTLDPGEGATIFSGPGAPPTNLTINWLNWTTDYVFRDFDPTDYARLVNAADATVDQENCPAEEPTITPTTTATATATATATSAPAETATTTPTATPTPSPTPSPTPTAMPSPTPSPTPTGPPQTVLTAAAAAGSSQISVADAARFAVGDSIAVGSGASTDVNTIDGIAGGAPGIFALAEPLEFDHEAGETVLWIPAPTPTPSPTATDTPTPAATPEFGLAPSTKATAVPATATPIAAPPTGSGGDGGIGGLGLALALLLAAALLAGTASLIAFSFRQQE